MSEPAHCRCHPRHNAVSGYARGMTLLEILLVLLVISLSALLVYPNLRPSLQAARTKATVRKVAAFLDDHRRRAVMEGLVIVVSMASDEPRIVARREGKGEETISSLMLPEGAEVKSFEPEEIRYYAQGHSSGGVVTLRIAGRPGSRIEIGSFTGLTRISEEER